MIVASKAITIAKNVNINIDMFITIEFLNKYSTFKVLT
jgi:hypothetical protein